MKQPLMFKPGDYVKLVIPKKCGWHLAKRFGHLNGLTTHIVSRMHKVKGEGLSYRTKGYYKLYLTSSELIPPQFVRPLLDHTGPITDEVVIANRIFAKLKLNLT